MSYCILLFWATPYLDAEEDFLECSLNITIFIMIMGARLRRRDAIGSGDAGEALIIVAAGLGLIMILWSLFVDLSKYFVHRRILSYSREQALTEFDKGLNLEALTKFLAASNSKQLGLYKRLRTSILNNKKKFHPVQLWVGLNDMIMQCEMSASPKFHRECLAKLNAFLRIEENVLMVRVLHMLMDESVFALTMDFLVFRATADESLKLARLVSSIITALLADKRSKAATSKEKPSAALLVPTLFEEPDADDVLVPRKTARVERMRSKRERVLQATKSAIRTIEEKSSKGEMGVINIVNDLTFFKLVDKSKVQQLVQQGSGRANLFLEYRARLLIHNYVRKWRAAHSEPRPRHEDDDPKHFVSTTKTTSSLPSGEPPALHQWEHGPGHVEMQLYDASHNYIGHNYIGHGDEKRP